MSWTHEHQAALPGTPEEVWTALTEPDQLRRWFAESVQVEPQAGGAYRFWGKHTYGAPPAGTAA